MSRIAFLNDTSAWYHWGCTATSTAIRETLVARGHIVNPISIQQLHQAAPFPRSPTDFDSKEFFQTFFGNNPLLSQAMLQNDTILINGEGSLHRTSALSLTLLYLAYAAKKYFQKNVQIINHSCYPEGDDTTAPGMATAVYQAVYRMLDYVAIREHRSLAVMEKLGVKATLSFDSLPLYLRDHPQPAATRAKKITVAGSVAWDAKGIEALAGFMKRMSSQGYAIEVLTGAQAMPAADDATFVRALKEAMPQGWLHQDAKTIDAWFAGIAGAELLLSGRFHYTIAACMLDTPAVVLGSNTPKNRALTEMAGLPDPLAYGGEGLEQALQERADAALGTVPLSAVVKQEWIARAEKNFDGVAG